ncbi:hypothetical protein [Myceligenerans crystallogenes]|uniref:Uncharacterized protein n=1 Tax=Myceligenerans crystallogenes TaxID=316335 RepID=A0ABP4ZJQ1_9MICO
MFDELAAEAEAQWRETMAQIRRRSGQIKEPQSSAARPGAGTGTARPIVKVTNYIWVFGDDARVTAGQEVEQEVLDKAEVAALQQSLAWALRYLGVVDLTADDATEIRTEIGQALDELARSTPSWDEVTPKLQVIKKVLTPVVTGVSQAVTAQAAEAASDILERLAPWLAG